MADTLYSIGAFLEASSLYSELLASIPAERQLEPEPMLYKARLVTCKLIACDFASATRLCNTIFILTPADYRDGHVHFALALLDTGRVFAILDEPDKGLRCLDLALSIFSALLGDSSRPAIRALVVKSDILMQKGDFDSAGVVLDRALGLVPGQDGDRAELRFSVWLGLARLAAAKGDIAGLENAAGRAREILNTYGQMKHEQAQQARIELSGILAKTGLASQALDLLAPFIEEKNAQTVEDRVMYRAISLAASIAQGQGNYPLALEQWTRALSLADQLLPASSPERMELLLSLANCERDLGKLSAARERYNQIAGQVEGDRDMPAQTRLRFFQGAARFYLDIFDLETAESMLFKNMNLVENTYGHMNEKAAECLLLLGEVKGLAGDAARRDSYIQRAYDILRQTRGEKHPKTAMAKARLSQARLASGDTLGALVLMENAVKILGETLGPNHPDLLELELRQAEIMLQAGEKNRALALYRRLLAKGKTVFGDNHPFVAEVADGLGFTLVLLGRYDEAVDFMGQAQEIDAAIIKEVLGFSSQRRKIIFLEKKIVALHRMLYIALLHPDRPELTAAAFNAWVRRKGVMLEAEKRFQEALYYSSDPEILKTKQALRHVRNELSKLVFQEWQEYNDSFNDTPAMILLKRRRLLDQQSELERRLIEKSSQYSRRQKTAAADAAGLASALPEYTALVEYVRVEYQDLSGGPASARPRQSRYLAFVLHARDPRVRLVDLGEAQFIEAAVARARQAITDLNSVSNLKAAPGAAPSGIQRDARQALSLLYELVFKPVEPLLRGKTEVFLSLDGDLALLPFEVMQNQGRYLVERYLFNYLSVSRDVLAWQHESRPGSPAAVFGDPAFDLDQVSKKRALQKMGGPRPRSSSAVEMKDDRSVLSSRGIVFSALPGTGEEAREICQSLGQGCGRIYLGENALEEVLFKIDRPAMLHLATHGFLLPPPEKAREKGGLDVLQRAGLALAGANCVVSGRCEGGGIVTAAEILDLDLRGTEAVVLSACNTGLGAVISGEGVFGLSRAFLQTGARSLVISMWEVPDLETKELMVRFYSFYAREKENRCHTLRQAVLAQIEIERDRLGWAPPNLWGAFIFQGNPF